jgi:general secretion pathway protein D
MRQFLAVLALLLTVALPAAADKAKNLYYKGRDAEARQNYEQAYDFYKQAYDLRPQDLRYRTAFLRMRTQAAAAHVHRGIQLRENGNLEEALAEFQHAVEIDPGMDAAQQELRRTQEMIQRTQPKAPPGLPVSELGQIASTAQGPAELKPIANTPITLRATEDAKTIYTTVGKIAGINVLFDPDYQSRRITIDLNNVSLYDALEIVALESKTFWRAVTPNTIFVASDTKTKRTELEENVVKTFYLSNAYTTTDVQDTINTIRTLTDITRLVPLQAQSAIVVRGTPDQVALAEKIINDIDHARPEVLVDVAVMQVSRDKIRQLGINPPGQATITLQNNITTTTTTTPTTTTGGTTTTPTSTPTTSTPQITLNKLANLTSNDFVVSIPSASVAFLMSDSDTKIIQNPQVRALNQTKATLKIGDRVPVATGSFQPGIGGVGINPLVNTQFQYIDVGVNIDITPTVHMDRSVSLKIVMEVSSVTSHVNIGGIDQPVIGQRRSEAEIRLKEGEVNLMGGMLEDTNLNSVAGWPFISRVPILRYLFSQENVEHRTNEIVFAMTPHIVRSHDISDLNLRPLDVGTANAIELRRGSPAATPPTPPPPTATAPPAQQPAAVPPQQPAQPTAGQPQANSNPGTPAILSFEPAQIAQAAGSTFPVNVSIANASNVYAVPVEISYDPKQLQLLNVSNGQFLQRDGQPVSLVHREDEQKGTILVNATRPPGANGMSGQGTVFTLTFLAKGAGQSMLNITKVGARDPGQNPLPVNPGQAMVTVK